MDWAQRAGRIAVAGRTSRAGRRAVARGIAFAGLLIGLALPAPGMARQSADPPFTMNIGAQLQFRFTQTAPDGEGSFRVARARLVFSGAAWDHFSWTLMPEFGDSSTRLLDANARVAIASGATLWFGQGKAWFGRQRLTSSRNLHFVDRTIVDARFSADRQQGIALIAKPSGERVEVNVGIYNGDGINRPANSNDRLMTVARVVVTPWGAYAPVESAHGFPEEPQLAFGISGLRNTLGSGVEEVELTRLNLEGAFRLGGLNMTAEAYRESARPVEASSTLTLGWYGQAGYLFPGGRHEVAGRFGGIFPDTPEPGDEMETGLAYTNYLNGHNAKVQVDLRNLSSDQADRDRQELRLQLQIAF